MKMLIRLLLLVAILLNASEGQTQDVRKAMVHFDQALIPVWLYTHDGDIINAKSALFYLEFQWQKLNQRYQGILAEEEDWREGFRKVNDWLGDAYYAIDNNSALLAMNQLEHVKYEMIELRKHYGIPYYLDNVYNFHEAVDQLAETASDELFCLISWREFELMVDEVNAFGEKVIREPMDAGLYELDDTETRLFFAQKDAVRQLLEILNMEVSAAERERIAVAGDNLEKAALGLLQIFGNYDVSGTYYSVNAPDFGQNKP